MLLICRIGFAFCGERLLQCSSRWLKFLLCRSSLFPRERCMHNPMRISEACAHTYSSHGKIKSSPACFCVHLPRDKGEMNLLVCGKPTSIFERILLRERCVFLDHIPEAPFGFENIHSARSKWNFDGIWHTRAHFYAVKYLHCKIECT